MNDDYPRIIIKGNREKLEIDPKRFVTVDVESSILIEDRFSGEFKGRGLSLNPNYDWVIGWDSFNKLVLIPLRKSEEEF